MPNITSSLTVYFEDPYWVGVIERVENEKLRVNKVTFGSEPKDYMIYEFYNQNQYKLKFSSPISADEKKNRKINPKRMQREINKHLNKKGISTKSQDAIRMQRDKDKTERRKSSKDRRKEEAQRKYQLKQEKKKQKKRGH